MRNRLLFGVVFVLKWILGLLSLGVAFLVLGGAMNKMEDNLGMALFLAFAGGLGSSFFGVLGLCVLHLPLRTLLSPQCSADRQR